MSAPKRMYTAGSGGTIEEQYNYGNLPKQMESLFKGSTLT